MNLHPFWKLSALTLSLIAPAAMADWRNNGNIKRDQSDDSDYSDDRSRNDEDDADAEDGEESSGQDGRGFSLGLRAGYGLPLGKATGEADANLSDVISGIIPLQLDAGYFLTSHLYLGGSFQYAPGLLAEDCEEGASCSISVMRFGVNLAYHTAPFAKVDPWVGLGVGYERFNLSASAEFGGETIEASTTASGFEFAALQGGVDFKLSKHFAVGPFATFTVGQYSSLSVSDGEDSASVDIDEKAFHFWLMGGIKAQYRF
ncbi:autotransporter domain-containing protein [Stigmatella erecta]|uniref:Outer membrane protein beta-barrel domain-containing protein n=1 Tax=Stigmatella erecta TaxID=83460 RepID=A0A1I0KRK4_9BACT|nr:autotransporter domain-containing protein [Stigmatella erecta]SEU27564.1 Outer membrane protein beta-barrel domain-containing protein [Stigmatella erecta]